MESNELIVQQVYAAKDDMQAADQLITSYKPFILAETARFMKRRPIEGQDEEISIAMIAFHEAVNGYSKTRGSFLKYASMLIKNRLIDHWRTNKRHRGQISLDEENSDDDDSTMLDSLSEKENPQEDRLRLQATQDEIAELAEQMKDFGVSMTDIAENSPKQERTLEACTKVINHAKENPELIEHFIETKRLPITKLAQGANVEKKTLERHRKYLVAMLLIYSNGYEIIRGHLSHKVRGESV